MTEKEQMKIMKKIEKDSKKFCKKLTDEELIDFFESCKAMMSVLEEAERDSDSCSYDYMVFHITREMCYLEMLERRLL